MEWIKVTTRLPKENEDVGFTWDGICISNNDWYSHKRKKWLMTDYENNDDKDVPDPITHWMPLPEPPLD
jgi:Protein of unknown function (DUF551)